MSENAAVNRNNGLPLLIGLNGFKGVGKDTVGQIMVDNWEFKRIAFADKLKEAAAALWGIPLESVDRYKDGRGNDVYFWTWDSGIGPLIEMSWRNFLQRFGTEMGRDVFGEDFWVDQVLPNKEFSTAQADKRSHGNRVVTDARFENELIRIHDLNGYNIRIVRPDFTTDGHDSELEPTDRLIDYVIENDGTLEDLVIKVTEALTYIYREDRNVRLDI